MAESKNIKYSIIVPCYNEELYIAKTLESLCQQTIKERFEIIVINNNCTDNTESIAKQYKVKVVNEERPGVCYARQAGVNVAKGSIIVSTDADTVFDKDWLLKIDNEFNKNKDLVAVCGSCRYIDSPWWGIIYPHILFGFVSIYNKLFNNIVYITATNIAFKKSYFEGYNTELSQGGDEIALLGQLKKKGPVLFKKKLKVHTSSRRLTKGLFYNVFISFFYYYLIAYKINKKYNRRIIDSAPAYRSTKLKTLKITPVAMLFVIVIFGVIIAKYSKNSFELTKDAYVLAKDAFSHIYNILT